MSGMSAQIEASHRRLLRPWRRAGGEVPAEADAELPFFGCEALGGQSVIITVGNGKGVVVGVGILHAQEQPFAGRYVCTQAETGAGLPIQAFAG